MKIYLELSLLFFSLVIIVCFILMSMEVDTERDNRGLYSIAKDVQVFIAKWRAFFYSTFHWGTEMRVETEYIKQGWDHYETVTFVGVVGKTGIEKEYFGKSRQE